MSELFCIPCNVNSVEVRIDAVKVGVISNLEEQRTRYELRSVLGFDQFYSHFVKEFANESAALDVETLSKRKSFQTPRKWKSLDEFKNFLASPLVLAFQNFVSSFVVEINTSSAAVGRNLQ